jgi:hypothetical protein
VFGGQRPEGGVQSLADIFKGLGREFREFGKGRAPSLAGAAGAGAMGAARSMVAGTFSGRAAGLMGGDVATLRVARDQLKVLKDIKVAVERGATEGASGVGGRVW